MRYTTEQMAQIFSRATHVQRMLDFEAALARAEARAGIIPENAATSIEQACRADLFDVDQIYQASIPAGTLAIPLVKALTAVVEPGASRYVHLGATSQDTIDTAMMLQMRDGLAILDQRMYALAGACAGLAETHRETPMVGRTLNQQALPITFGLKAARWLAMLTRQLYRLRDLRSRVLVVQFGGAAGTLASLGDAGLQVAEYLAEELDLGLPDLPWHTERDRVVEIGSSVGLLAGCVLKIAGDLALLVQSEVGEISERSAPGKGGSSAMPHKRNPVDIIGAIAAARLATGMVPTIASTMTQEHERAAGAWQAEWEAVPNLFQYTDHALKRVLEGLEGLEVDEERMRSNLELTHGLIMAESLAMSLASRVGRPEGYRMVQAACERSVELGTSLLDVALDDREILSALSPSEVEDALRPERYTGSTGAFIDRALADFRELPRPE